MSYDVGVYLKSSSILLQTPTLIITYFFATIQKQSKYHHLERGEPRDISKVKLISRPGWSRGYPITLVEPWDRHLAIEPPQPFHHPDTIWTYSDGLLILPSAAVNNYVVYDVATEKSSELDLDSRSKIVRRIRLNERVLIVEWCEREPYHRLNESEVVHRHFATAYDIVKDTNHSSEPGQWTAIFRNEWKIHFLGMPLNHKDRFFTTHTSTHYALYLWQPNRSAWGEDEPLEGLALWDISSPSSYRPSQDPSGRGKPDTDLEGVRLMRRFSFSELDFYGIRQGFAPRLLDLALDDGHIYIIQEDHSQLVGLHAGDTRMVPHSVSSIGIPFYEGPHWRHCCGAEARGVDQSLCERIQYTQPRNLSERYCIVDKIARLPISDWTRPEIAPCWRHIQHPTLTLTCTIDVPACITFLAHHPNLPPELGGGEAFQVVNQPWVNILISGPEFDSVMDKDWAEMILAKGRICGDERWVIGENMGGEVVVLRF